MIIETVILSGAAVAGAQAMRRYKGLDRFIAMQRQLKSCWAGWTASPRVDVPDAEVRRADRFLVLSAASLGMTVAGLVLTQPWLSLTGIPPALIVFVPTFRRACKTLRHERRIDNHVLDATRVVLCVVLRYDTITAMNALLQAGSQKFFAQSEATFRRRIDALPWTNELSSLTLLDVLKRTVSEKSSAQADGEANAGRMAPWMLATFALSWPILGPNRAAAFLTTGFGAHLRTLGPFTVRNAVLAAAQEGVVIFIYSTASSIQLSANCMQQH